MTVVVISARRGRLAPGFRDDRFHVERTGNAALVRVAVGNLLDNALSFSPPGGAVHVELDAAGLLTVRDEGPGIPPDKLIAVFEPFMSFPPNRKGHGLGLAIVTAVVDLHGGSVSAEKRRSCGPVLNDGISRGKCIFHGRGNDAGWASLNPPGAV